MNAEAALDALGEPRRRAILGLLREAPQSVNDLATELEITQQATSRHLQVLKGAGLVTVRAEAQRRLYAIRPEGIEEVQTYLASFWPRRMTLLRAAVERQGQRRG